MNAGGRFGDIGRTVRRVQVMDSTGPVYYRDRDDLVFSYRKSNIAASFILGVEFDLTPEDPEATDARGQEDLHAQARESQPLADHSAGCAFKNPPPDEMGRPRSAGRLIDKAGRS